MREVLGPVPVIVRIMPNLGVELGAGAVAFASEPGAPAATVSAVLGLLRPLGSVEVVPEDLFDAVTAVSGSGPAFLALAVESLEDGAVAAGLSRPAARAAVRRSMLDTARLLTQYSDSPERLREQAVRAGRVDPTALGLLEERGVRSAYRRAVEAAVQRSREMRKA
jgi:pyrroline-5-carboxylate reductase